MLQLINRIQCLPCVRRRFVGQINCPLLPFKTSGEGVAAQKMHGNKRVTGGFGSKKMKLFMEVGFLCREIGDTCSTFRAQYCGTFNILDHGIWAHSPTPPSNLTKTLEPLPSHTSSLKEKISIKLPRPPEATDVLAEAFQEVVERHGHIFWIPCNVNILAGRIFVVPFRNHVKW